jgi:aspartate aminotransferase
MRHVQGSQTIALDTKAKALLAAGHEVINLSVGELDFSAPTTVQQAVAAAATGATNHYSPVAGLAASKAAVVVYEREYHGIEYQSEQILITNGAKQALYTIFLALVDPGDEVLVLQPAWVSYVTQIQLAGGKPIAVETSETFLPDLVKLEQAITPQTKGLVLNYPNNPTGVVYDQATLQQLAKFAQRHNLWVVSDEIYEHIVYDQTHFYSFAQLYPNTIVVNGISKAAAVTGWRVGYAAGPAAIIKAMTALQSHITGNVSNVMQAALLPALALGLPTDWLSQLHHRRQLVLDWVATQPRLVAVPPQGAFYCFIDIRQLHLSSEQLCEHLLQKHYVALVPGIYFGRDGFVRLSFAHADSAISVALQRWSDCLTSCLAG